MSEKDYYYKRSIRRNNGGRFVQKICPGCGFRWEDYPNAKCPKCGHYRGKGK